MFTYWRRAVAHTYTSLRAFIIDLGISFIVWIVSYVINYYRIGRAGASNESASSAFSGFIPSAIALGSLFIVRLFIITPPKMDKSSHEREEILLFEKERLLSKLQDIQTPQLKVEIRQGDNRYIRATDVGIHGVDTWMTYQGFISIENQPDQVKSVHDVVAVLTGIISSGGEDLRKLSNVRLRLEDQLPVMPITIDPGEMKFAHIVQYNATQGEQLFMSHNGTDGQSVGAVTLASEHTYTAKIHVRARDMPLLQTNVSFGVNNGRLFLEQVE